MWQRKLRSRPDKHFPTSPAAKASRYLGKHPRLCRVLRSKPELRYDPDRPAHRAGILLPQGRQRPRPGPAQPGARWIRWLRYFFSRMESVARNWDIRAQSSACCSLSSSIRFMACRASAARHWSRVFACSSVGRSHSGCRLVSTSLKVVRMLFRMESSFDAAMATYPRNSPVSSSVLVGLRFASRISARKETIVGELNCFKRAG
jgi:hypothetical protein